MLGIFFWLLASPQDCRVGETRAAWGTLSTSSSVGDMTEVDNHNFPPPSGSNSGGSPLGDLLISLVSCRQGSAEGVPGGHGSWPHYEVFLQRSLVMSWWENEACFPHIQGPTPSFTGVSSRTGEGLSDTCGTAVNGESGF